MSPNAPADHALGDSLGPLVTVVIRACSDLPLVQHAVGSVLAQSRPDWELLIVHEGSAEITRAEWLGSIIDPRVRLLPSSPLNDKSAARLRALAVARAPYLLFLDENDRLVPEALSHLVDGVRNAPDAVAVIGGRVTFDKQGKRRRVHHPHRALTRRIWTDVMVGWSAAAGMTLYRQDVVRALVGYDGRLDDHDLLLRASARGMVRLIPEVVLEEPERSAVQPSLSDLRDVREVLNAFIARSGRTRRRSGVRLLRCWESGRAGDVAIADHRYALALRCYLKELWTCPALLGSPLVGGRLAAGSAKALLGACLGPAGPAFARAAQARARVPVGSARAGGTGRDRAMGGPEGVPDKSGQAAWPGRGRSWRAGIRTLLPGSAANLAVQGLLLLFGLGTGAVTARVLGPAQRGELSFLILVPSTLTVVGSLGVEYGTYYLWHREHGKLRQQLLAAGGVVTALSGTLCAAIGVAVVSWFEPRAGLLPALLVAFGTPLSVANAILTMALMAHRKVGAYNVSRLIGPMAYTAVLASLWASASLSVTSVLLAWFGSLALTVATDVLLVGCMGTGLPRWGARTARRSVGYGLRSYVGTVAQYGTLQLDQGLLVALAGNGALGLYYAAVSIGQVVLYLANNIASAMLAQLGGRPRTEQRQLALVATVATAAGTGVAVLLLMFLGGEVITLALGRAYLPGLTALQILLPGLVFLAAARVLNGYFIAVGEARVFARAALASLVVTVVGDLALIPKFDAAGAALASTIAYAVMMTWLGLKFRSDGNAAAVRRPTRRVSSQDAPVANGRLRGRPTHDIPGAATSPSQRRAPVRWRARNASPASGAHDGPMPSKPPD